MFGSRIVDRGPRGVVSPLDRCPTCARVRPHRVSSRGSRQCSASVKPIPFPTPPHGSPHLVALSVHDSPPVVQATVYRTVHDSPPVVQATVYRTVRDSPPVVQATVYRTVHDPPRSYQHAGSQPAPPARPRCGRGPWRSQPPPARVLFGAPISSAHQRCATRSWGFEHAVTDDVQRRRELRVEVVPAACRPWRSSPCGTPMPPVARRSARDVASAVPWRRHPRPQARTARARPT